MTRKRCRLAVLLSGTGSTMVNLQEHIERGEVPAEIAVVVSSREKVLGLERAEGFGLPTRVLVRKPYKRGDGFDADAYSSALVELLEPFEPDLLVMAGFMTMLARPALERWPVVNVHPALLPLFGGEGFYGHHVHEAVLEAGVKITGATAHFADAAYDRGPIIVQEAVSVSEDDTADTLAARVKEAERRIYPRAVALFAEGRLQIEGQRVRVLEEEA
ncbi:MAG: phosphoribosylglycinamide formyltransferase [Deltaproteobacteria bacterium]|nr:phosphoribosylglycinamide formyltransferase [Deltaproteobacteria bacterium]